MKISIVGAGNVGSALAERILTHDIADVVLIDVEGDMAKAKALDLMDSAPLMGFSRSAIGTGDYREAGGSDVVVITAGFPRKPGMSREDLIIKNGNIVKLVASSVKRYSPSSIVIIVTNPLDTMTYLAYRELECDRRKIMGMAGNLDTARFKAILSEETGTPCDKIKTCVLGSHGDTMVPLVSKTMLDGKSLRSAMTRGKVEKILERTKKRGGEIVRLLKSGSAYFSPSAACFEILKAIANDEKREIPCSCVLDGEYGIKDCAVGVPAKIGKLGVEEVIRWDLEKSEFEALGDSANLVKDCIRRIDQA